MRPEANLASFLKELRDTERVSHEVKKFDSTNLKFVEANQVQKVPALAARASFLTSASLYEAATVKFPPMANAYTKELHDEFANAQERLTKKPDMTCLRLRDVHFIGKVCAVFDAQTGSVLSGHAIGWGASILRKRQVAMERFLRPSRRVTKPDPQFTYVLIDQPGIKVYGHFLLDVIPKIFMAETLIGSNTKFLLRLFEPWVKPLLESLGIAADRIVPVQQASFLHFDELYVPFIAKSGFAVNIRVLREAWAHFTLNNPTLPSADPKARRRRLFLSRANLVGRPRATNEDALFAIAQRYGFERISPEGLSFPVQVKLFSAADYIVGEDGSALHSSIFCKQGRAVIAFMRPDRENLWHLAFAQAAGLDFHAIKCENAGNTYSADPIEFERILRAVVT